MNFPIMDQKAIIKSCKEMGCCNACCLRYLGIKNPTAYENAQEFIDNLLDCKKDVPPVEEVPPVSAFTNPNGAEENVEPIPTKKLKTEDEEEVEPASAKKLNTDDEEEVEPTPAKKLKIEDQEVEPVPAENQKTKDEEVESDSAKKLKTEDVCVSCIGVLQEEAWPPCLQMVKEELDKKGYECASFACALSAPVAALVRERGVALELCARGAGFEAAGVTPLKEAWKWAAGAALERAAGKALDSGAVAPLLVTLQLQYAPEAEELAALRACAGGGRGAGYTRRGAERALEAAPAEALRAAGLLPPPPPAARVTPAQVSALHAPIYLGGRYVKLSRSLPQTPWVLRGERIMPSSVQEIIFTPLAAALGLPPDSLKFMAAGREDVDVRCLGSGRPFAVEVADPRRTPSAAELRRACDDIEASGAVRVRSLQPVARARLAELKRGEEVKRKTYEALCVKLAPAPVTPAELQRVLAAAGELRQRTPLRVLHRRAAAERRRALRAEAAAAVPGHPALFVLRLSTDAGTYVKEWAHGDLRRTRPALSAALRAPADILALDVTHVHLDWP